MGKISKECEKCGKSFFTWPCKLRVGKGRFCSRQCGGTSGAIKLQVPCGTCGKPLIRTNHRIKRSMSGKSFCNHSCSTLYTSKHKTSGYRRSKIELYMEKCIKRDFPNLRVSFNDRKTVGLELDIYFPDLRLAFELNGIFHYEPIYGVGKLDLIQDRDRQ